MTKRRGPTKRRREPLRKVGKMARGTFKVRGSRVAGRRAQSQRSAARPAVKAAALGPRFAADFKGWKLEDAKARFSEVVRRARSEGPQRVTVRGKDAVVVISAEEFDRLLPRKEQLPFVPFLEGLYVEGLDLTREPDLGRELEL